MRVVQIPESLRNVRRAGNPQQRKNERPGRVPELLHAVMEKPEFLSANRPFEIKRSVKSDDNVAVLQSIDEARRPRVAELDFVRVAIKDRLALEHSHPS